MAMKMKRPASSWTYVLSVDEDKPVEEQSRFLLRPLTVSERAAIRDDIARVHTAADGSQVTTTRTYGQGIEIVLEHVVSIENFPAGAPEPWPEAIAERRRYLEGLDDAWIQEIANEVWAKSTIANELKNS